jgi:hypothetical protein
MPAITYIPPEDYLKALEAIFTSAVEDYKTHVIKDSYNADNTEAFTKRSRMIAAAEDIYEFRETESKRKRICTKK